MAEEKKKEKKKKKKERVDINLPNARRSIKRSREMRQLRTNYEDLWKLIGGILAAGIVLFIVLGGINQTETWKALVRFAEKIGTTIRDWFSGGDVNITDNGIYWQP
jgi:hypothetical protein